MKNDQESMLLLDQVIGPALHDAFLKAAEHAKQTRTYLVMEHNGQIERIDYEKIDAFIAEQEDTT